MSMRKDITQEIPFAHATTKIKGFKQKTEINNRKHVYFV